MNNESVSFKDIMETIIRSRWMLASFFVIAIVMTYFFYLTTPKSYTAEATILPIAGGAGGGMADFLTGTGLGMLVNAETKANVILIAFDSQTLAENVLNKLNISDSILNMSKDSISEKSIYLAAIKLKGSIVKPFVTKNGSIKISAAFNDPKIAADIVNTYIDELALFFNKKGINMNFNIIDKAQVPIKASAPLFIDYLVKSILIAFFFSILYISLAIGSIKK